MGPSTFTVARTARPTPAPHRHAWALTAVEHDEFGTVRMVGCCCGAVRYDDRQSAA